MSAIPKPEPRAPKRRKRIERKRRPRRQRKSTPAALAREADRIWGLIVRATGRCEANGKTPLCRGALQAAHGISRRYRHTRWLPINGFCLCQAHHLYYTHRSLEWEQYLVGAWGQDVYNDLRLIALRAFRPDVGAALEALRDEAKARGVQV